MHDDCAKRCAQAMRRHIRELTAQTSKRQPGGLPKTRTAERVGQNDRLRLRRGVPRRVDEFPERFATADFGDFAVEDDPYALGTQGDIRATDIRRTDDAAPREKHAAGFKVIGTNWPCRTLCHFSKLSITMAKPT